MLTKIRMKEEKGFTLIELLIVVAIIGILAAIAIPQFGAYRRRGYNSAAISDLRTIRTTQEAMMADFQDYGASHTTGATDNTGVPVGSATAGMTVWLSTARTTTTPQSVNLSKGVFVQVLVKEISGVNSTYTANSTHSAGDQMYGVDSDSTSVYRKNCSVAGACVATEFNTTTPAPQSNEFGTGGWIAM